DAEVRDLGLAELQKIDAPAEERNAFVRPRLAGDDVHHRRLAGAVRADDAAQLARIDVQAQRVESLESVEADRDAVEVENPALRNVERRVRGKIRVTHDFFLLKHAVPSSRGAATPARRRRPT